MNLKMAGVHFIVLALFVAKASGGIGLCLPEHPQKATCRSKFVLKGEILSIDWEKDQKTTAAPTTTRPPTTTSPPLTLPRPEDGETDFLIGRKPDPNLVNLFKKGQTVVTGTDFLAEPAMLPFFRPKYIRVRLEKLMKGIKYLPRTIGYEFSIRFASMHRVPYEVGKTYLLTGFTAGKELIINECNWFSEWGKLSDVMFQGVRRYYWRYCGCRIKNCFGMACKTTVRQCAWNIPFNKVGLEKSDFLSRNRICMVYCGRRCKWLDPREKLSC